VSARTAYATALMSVYVLAAAAACSRPHDYDRVAIVAVQVAGQQVFFKQAVWGRNGLAVSISADSSSGPIPKPEDYAWCCAEPPIVLFKAEASALHLWQSADGEWKPPTRTFPVPVVFHTVPVLELSRLSATPSAFGLKKIGFHDWALVEPPASPVPLP
jgi:hypothetical protein